MKKAFLEPREGYRGTSHYTMRLHKSRGQLEDVSVHRLPPLLDEEEPPPGRHGDDDDDSVDAGAFDELPPVPRDEAEVPAGVELLHAGTQSEKTEPLAPDERGPTFTQPPWAAATAATTVRPRPVPGTLSDPAKRW